VNEEAALSPVVEEAIGIGGQHGAPLAHHAHIWPGMDPDQIVVAAFDHAASSALEE
jgi:hypothetical protein